ncbi:type II toxin-antitoxin system VapC family toxin [Afifella sp. H1R]|uniref:PIN domain-containing protein n=1 Tax=unclassified Afifella TaxID=2624128 RepID=UPI001F3F749B|nr:type II toxin-antitoxin system VapC family toxin [Afifella sp. JA880]MCF1505771.1 type II toxin-antitoxin system VapC family toxin [Afifella sp. H1R]MCT8266654.1 type II toxin-antitoxin system VapC family toxin [Afifella sp. JA880]
MIALDTNVLLRYVLDDDDRHSEAARHLIDDLCDPDAPAFVHEVAMAEFVWVLTGRRGTSRAEIAGICRTLMDNSHLSFRDVTGLSAALDAYEDGPADFAEYLIAAQSRNLGAAPTFTFDTAALKSPGFAKVES